MEIETTQKKKSHSKSSKKIRTQSKQKKDKNKFGLFKCNFISYNPQKIVEISINQTANLLAVARENCFIEIFKANSWAIIAKFDLQKDYNIKKIIWVDNNSFIVGCLNGFIIKYSLTSLIPQIKYLSQGGAIFDMCLNQLNNILLVSQADGCLRSYFLSSNTDETDQFQIKLDQSSRNFSSIIVCCCWDYEKANEFYASFQDGLIRKFQNFNSTTLAIKQPIINKIQIFAWKILSLPNNTLITGANNGTISIFETNFGTCIKTFNTHQADILSLIINRYNSQIVYATGADSKIVTIEKISDNQGSNWQLTSQERGQSHDIYALSMINENTLVSGGVSTDICIYKLIKGRFVDRNIVRSQQQSQEIQKNSIKLRHVSAFPQKKYIFVTNIQEVVCILVNKQFSIEFWRMNKSSREIEYNFEIETNQFPVICAGLQKLGKYFAYSTEISTKIYKISKKDSILLNQELKPSQSIEFSNSFNQSLFLQITLDGKIIGYNLTTKASFQIINNLSQFFHSKEQQLETQIYQYSELSENNQYFVLGSKVTSEILVLYDIFKFKKDKKQLNDQQQQFTIPKLELDTTFMTFKINEDNHQLIIAYDNNKIAIFHLNDKCQTHWSFQNFSKLPKNLLSRYNKIQGIIISELDHNRILLYTNYYYILLIINQKCPHFSRTFKQYQGEERQNLDLIYFDKPMLSLNYCEDNQYVLIENKWEQMLEGIQDPINAKKFGL